MGFVYIRMTVQWENVRKDISQEANYCPIFVIWTSSKDKLSFSPTKGNIITTLNYPVNHIKYKV